MRRVYSVNNKKLYIYCEIIEYCKLIENWLSIYETIPLENYDSYIKIYYDKTIWNIDGTERYIKGKIIHTDLYPLFYNSLANMIIDDTNMLLHSAVLRYNNVGVLVIGDFNSGKTTLCLDAIENNIKVLSTDQTHLFYKEKSLMFKNGSIYMKINENNYMLINHDNCKTKIKFIINLIGVCDKGKVYFDLIDNNNHKIKMLFKSCTWHADIPLYTNDILLNIDRIKILKWLSKINLPLYNVRGDSKGIIKKIKESLK